MTKTAAIVVSLVILLLAGIAYSATQLYVGYPHFHDNKGKELPYNIVDSIVKASYHKKPLTIHSWCKKFYDRD